VLDADGEIFGLPVSFKLTPGIVTANPDLQCSLVWFRYGGLESEATLCSPSDLEVYADGIRVLEIDGRLYRVTGHRLDESSYIREKDNGVVNSRTIAEPLIPDKPKPKYCDKCGAELKGAIDADD